MKTSILIALTALCGLISAQAIQAQSGQELFQQALVMELSHGRVRAAIPLYQRIVMEFASDRALVAKALIRLGAAQEALGSTEAKRAYQRIVSYYPDQREQLVVAQSRLAALTTETVGGGDGEVRRVLQPSALCSDQSDAAIATFEDANLRVRVRSALLIGPREDLTCSLVSGLTVLDASGTGIESLVGIQNLTGLTRLDLRSNSITDISQLSGLTGLLNLDVGTNSITNISALSGLTNLTRLTIRCNYSITDISALSGLTNLTGINMRCNSITDLSPLSRLTNLRYIHFGLNKVTDISPLSELTNLTDLRMLVNSVSDISPLSGLTKLTTVRLQSNSISDISALGGLTSLTEAFLSGNSISDLSPLSGLTGLTNLYLRGNRVTNISGLSRLTSLTDIGLGENPDLRNIQPLLDNTGLGAGDMVYLQSTNVSCTDVAALRVRVRVQSDCP